MLLNNNNNNDDDKNKKNNNNNNNKNKNNNYINICGTYVYNKDNLNNNNNNYNNNNLNNNNLNNNINVGFYDGIALLSRAPHPTDSKIQINIASDERGFNFYFIFLFSGFFFM